MPDDVPRWRPSAHELETIARNIGLKQAEPDGILAHLAAALHDDPAADLATTAGLLYKLILVTRPFAENSWTFALEAARVLMIANGFPATRISYERAQALHDDVESGRLTFAAEIGQRLKDLGL